MKKLFKKASILAILSMTAVALLSVGCKQDEDDTITPSYSSIDSQSYSVVLEDTSLTASSSSTEYASVSIDKSCFVFNPLTYISGDNKTFNKEISEFTSILAADIYDTTAAKLDGASTEAADDAAIYKKLGFKDVTEKEYTNISRTEFAHQEFLYDNTSYSIIICCIEGTIGYEQWTSNFNVGYDGDVYYSKAGSNALWTNKQNHAGFDIAANTINSYLKRYISQKCNFSNTQKIIIFTGHSRGAAISNILGSTYEKDENYKTFTYTFACPETTCDTTAAEACKTAFNIVNSDDLIPVMPLAAWGFTRYGTDKAASVNDTYTSQWIAATGFTSYSSANAQTAIAEGGFLTNICDTRKSLYEITVDTKNSWQVKFSTSMGPKDEATAWAQLEEYHLTNLCNVAYVKDESTDCEYLKGQICPAFATQFIPVLCKLETLTEQGKFLLTYAVNLDKTTYYKMISKMVSGYSNNGIVTSHSSTTYVILAQNLE